MSIITSVGSVTSECSIIGGKPSIFQDLPLVNRTTRLNVIELRNSDKQIVNELVYRWCRILTRISKRSLDRLAGPSDTAIERSRRVLVIDMVGSTNPIRLATVLKRDERRMRMIGIVRSCKINSTFATLNTYIGRQASFPDSLRLLVIYQDEFFIMKTFDLIREFIQATKSQVLLVVPKLDRREHDILNLTTNYQIIKCDFCVSRYEVGPNHVDGNIDSHHSYLNQIYFRCKSPNRTTPERIDGELRDDGLSLKNFKVPKKTNDHNQDYQYAKRAKVSTD